MEIIRYKNSIGKNYYNYEFTSDNKTFNISFGGNLDLYWSLNTNQEYTSYEEAIKELYDTFTITKENYEIYSLFKTLIEEIKEPQVFTPNQEVTINDSGEVEQLPPSIEELERTNKYNKELKDRDAYQHILDNDSIVWHSDEEPYDIADIVKITEREDTILLEFFRPELTGEKYGMRRPGTITIRFRNSGSFYHPFNIVFMKMFNKLQEFDPELDKEYHQIHIEELSYQLKKKK